MKEKKHTTIFDIDKAEADFMAGKDLLECSPNDVTMNNRSEFESLIRSTKRCNAEKLLEYLEQTDFYTAPASGTCKVTQVTTLPESMPTGVTAADLVGLKVEGDFLFGNDYDGFGGFNDVINMWINTQDFTIILPDQQIAPDCVYPGVGTHPGEADNGEGEVDTLNNALTFYLRTLWGPYTFGDAEIKLQF